MKHWNIFRNMKKYRIFEILKILGIHSLRTNNVNWQMEHLRFSFDLISNKTNILLKLAFPLWRLINYWYWLYYVGRDQMLKVCDHLTFYCKFAVENLLNHKCVKIWAQFWQQMTFSLQKKLRIFTANLNSNSYFHNKM